MAEPLIQGMGEVELGPGMTLKWEARDATTGAEVAGVVVSEVGIYATNLGTSGVTTDEFGPFMYVPGPNA